MKWMKFKWLYFLLSALVLVPGIISLIFFGLRPAIDFTGGTLLEYKFTHSIDKETIKKTIEGKDQQVMSIQLSGENKYLLRMNSLTREQAKTIDEELKKATGETPQQVRFETVGPILGKELLTKTVIAILLAAGFILGFVAWSFKNGKFGTCAVLAMFHDSLVLLGSFSLLGHFFGVEVDTLFVTAVLTILSFSVHDTVVVYDRIRESQKLFPDTKFEDLVDKAITETLSRSLNNSLTIIFMLIALVLLGGETIRWFVIALLIGTVSGTYSSTFTAAPLLVVWTNLEGRKKKAEA